MCPQGERAGSSLRPLTRSVHARDQTEANALRLPFPEVWEGKTRGRRGYRRGVSGRGCGRPAGGAEGCCVLIPGGVMRA